MYIASDTEVAVIPLDQRKVIVRVEYLFKFIPRYGFDHSFIQWIKSLYFSIRSHILVNIITI